MEFRWHVIDRDAGELEEENWGSGHRRMYGILKNSIFKKYSKVGKTRNVPTVMRELSQDVLL